MTDRLRKWKPILDNVFNPYELDNEILEMVAEYVETNLQNTSNISLVSTSQDKQKMVLDTLAEFKERLCKDVDVRTEVKNIYYNRTINKIVYELENGDSVYMESKPLILRDPDYIKKSKRLFLSISDPNNPILRKLKIDEIKNKL